MNRLLYAAKRAAGWLGQLLHPRACVLCRKPLPARTSAMLCGTCAPQLYHTYRNTAPVRVPGTDGADAPLLYTGALATAMKRYKFYRSTALCRWFSAQAAACLAGHLDAWQPDCLAYVPLGAARWWSRGFNQSEAFARQIGKSLNLPVCHALGKRPKLGKQSRRSEKERWKAAQNMFFALPGQAVQGKRVVLVDDIITTGASASVAVRALKEAGASSVYVLAPLRTPYYPKEVAR